MCNVLTRTDSVIINYKLEIGSIKVKTMGGGGGRGGTKLCDACNIMTVHVEKVKFVKECLYPPPS